MSLYSLQSRDLKGLGPDKAVDFFRRLLWAEALRVGIARHLIDAPDCINVGDGGLDAVIKDAKPVSEDFIPAGISGFQIKSSDLQPAECRQELYSGGNLKPAIKRVLDANGVYVLVLFEEMPSETMKRDRENAILEELLKIGYNSPNVRVYTINQLISFAERYPALVSWLKGYEIVCLPYQKWANSRDVSYPRQYIPDNQREGIINEIRETLRSSNRSPRIFRIAGLSGLGKTRLIFEALSPDDLRNSVLYTTAGSLKNSPQLNALLLDDSIHAILVVDECSIEDHDYFTNRFSNIGSRIPLITISNEGYSVPSPTIYYQLNPMQESDIRKVLLQESKELPQNVTSRLAELAEGYPNFALLLLENYISSSESTQDFLNISELPIRKLIAAGIDPKTDWYRTTKCALMALSLFGKVGFKGELASEARYAANLASVDWDAFQKVISEQKRQRVIQGEYYVWITPFPLAVHLLREWWEIYGDNNNFVELIGNMPAALLDRFVSQLPFVTTKSGRKLVERLLSSEGIFADGTLLRTERGSYFFLKLAEADPQSAVNCLRRTIGTWSKQQLLEYRIGRRQIIWSLEKIAVWRELFADAARLLLSLGEAENESYANNASGVFAGLFSSGWGPLAPTEESLENRFPILIEALNSDSIERKKLALRAFRTALQATHLSRMIGAEYQGSRPVPKLWTPKSGEEIIQHYKRAWTYLEENLPKFSDDIRNDAAKVLTDSARGLNTVGLHEMIITTFRKISSYPWVDKSQLLETVSVIVHYDSKRMQGDTQRDWVALRDDLIGSGFSDLLRRYVEMDLIEDYFHNSEKYDDTWVKSKLSGLAEKVIENPKLLDSEYSWLLTEKAKRGHQFGYAVGGLDKDFSFLNKVVDRQKEAGSSGNLNFMGGYFRALFERNVELWEVRLDLLSRDVFYKTKIPELTWRSGMSDKAAKRILSLLQKGEIKIDTLGIFQFGGVIKKLSEPTFTDWALFILETKSGAYAPLLLNFVHTYYVYKRDKPIAKDITLRVLLQPGLWNTSQNFGNMVGFYWKEVALELMNKFPETGIELAENILKFFGSKISIVGGFDSEGISEILWEVTKRNPKAIWQKVVAYLDPPEGDRAFFIMRWLGGERGFKNTSGAIELFDAEDIWKWVDEKPDERARLLAHFVSPALFHSTDKTCFAREILVRYGECDDVHGSLSANYSTESWSGPASIHYMSKKKSLLEFKKEEKNEKVIEWIDKELESLERDIERAKMSEERDEF